MEEIYKDVKGYEGYYQISNYGNIRSLAREVKTSKGGLFPVKEKILKPRMESQGYVMNALQKDGKFKNKKVHHLVWDAFGDGTEISYPNFIIDHIDQNRANNRIDNLRIVNNRENQFNRKDSVEFRGAYYRKDSNNYYSKIQYNKK